MKNIVNLCILALLFANCNNKPAKEIVVENNDTITTENVVEENKKNVDNSNIIFSTEDLDNADWTSPEEYPLNIKDYEGTISTNMDYVIKLPKYKNFEVVIWSTEGGDNNPYALCIVKSRIMYVGTSLSITPFWSEPGNEDNNYCNKTFKIHKDYTIEITTEEKKDGGIKQKYTKFFKINDKGDFYEVESKE